MGKKIALAAIAAAAILAGLLIWRLDIPHWKKLDLNLIYAQPRTSIVYDASGAAVGTFASGQNRVWTKLDDIPPTVRNAFIAAEDQRFYRHHGINVKRIIGAALANLRSGGYAQGASTITQQLIKLTHLSEAKTLSRKAQEAFLALQLERKLSKDEILECYLNTIYFGKGAYGLGSASRIYFGKEPAQLTLAESALLAGVIKSPSGYAPHIHPEKSIQRRNLVLSEMQECGFITEDQAESAKKEGVSLVASNDHTRYGWFMDAALSEAADKLALSVDDVLSSGYAIYTAFDPALQDIADRLYADDANFPIDAGDGTKAQSALVAMAPDTGEIRAVMGGRDYEVRRGLNRATQITRSPGSAIKPISSYAAAIDAYGFSPTSMVEDTPREFAGGYAPGNAGGNTYGTVTLREALSRSLNIATVDLADLIGVNAVRAYAARFGLPLSWQDDNLALALGSMTDGVSPARLCAAYASLANGGTQVTPHFIRSIEDADGREVYRTDAPTQRAVQDSTAYMITDMLKTAASTGSARALAACGLPVAGKTGTVADADGSTRDIWTAAFTPDLALTVWMGFDNPDSEHRLSSGEGGSGYPARLCAAFLKEAASLLSGEDFWRPDSVTVALVDALALSQDEVRLVSSNTPSEFITAELFHPNQLPETYTSLWDAPEAVDDLILTSGQGETPVLQFTARSENAEYLILRTVDGVTSIVSTLSGGAGETLQYTDDTADLSKPAQYAVLPRHKLLYERGVTLTGKESAAAAYSPGGILNLFFGSSPASPEEEGADIELSDDQSLFG